MAGEALLIWLSRLLDERVCPGLTVRIVALPRPVYRLVYGDVAVEMPAWEWGLGTAVENCCRYDAQAEGWHSALGTPIPAPGAGQLRLPLIEHGADGYCIHYDILGFACWILSRAEEVGRTDLDEYGRFPAIASHAFRHGYLGRPVLDEWLHILRQVVLRVWPGLPLKHTEFRTLVSHDVDRPSEYAFCSTGQMLRAVCGDALKRGDLRSAVLRPWAWLNDRTLNPRDPCNTFGWIMDVSERRGMRSAFYFVCGRTDPARDPNYSIGSPAVRALLRDIHRRGHEVGLHPSYGTFREPAAIRDEAARLLTVCTEEAVTQDGWGGRMHYLRWNTPETLLAWDEAGMTYDSTLGYADLPGFRCGTCFEYTALEPVARRPLKLRIRPLIAMDVTVLSPPYMALGVTVAALEEFVKLKRQCRAVGGSFTLLWHNNHLRRAEERALYESVLEA